MKKPNYTKQEIDDFRVKFNSALLAVKSNGKPYLTEEQAQNIVDGYNDKVLAQRMEYNTPESLADIHTM